MVYADIEAIQQKIHSVENVINDDRQSSWTELKTEHIPSAIGYKIVCHDNDKLSKPIKISNGEDCIERFIKKTFKQRKNNIKLYAKF